MKHNPDYRREPIVLSSYEDIDGKTVSMRVTVDMNKLVAHFGRKALRSKRKQTATGYGSVTIRVA